MTEQKLRVGLIGAGVFGRYHANKLAQHAGVTFSGVFDHSQEHAETIAKQHNTEVFETPESLFEACDAVIIASPAITHGEYAIQSLQAGCHTLIEKPMATSLAHAEKILSLSESKNLVVQVGHQERFVAQAIGLDKTPELPTHIITIRNTPYSIRGTDTSVTLDLMSHDIDLCCMLMKGVPETVSGSTETIKSASADQARAELSFKDGTAILSSSRLEETMSRQTTIRYPSGSVLIDFAAKTLQHNTPFDLNADFGNDAKAADSLGAATDSFISAIIDGTPVSVTARDGLNAVEIALQIDGEI